MRIGFVGLGLMGLPIARHLIAAGHRLFIASGSPAEVRGDQRVVDAYLGTARAT